MIIKNQTNKLQIYKIIKDYYNKKQIDYHNYKLDYNNKEIH